MKVRDWRKQYVCPDCGASYKATNLRGTHYFDSNAVSQIIMACPACGCVQERKNIYAAIKTN